MRRSEPPCTRERAENEKGRDLVIPEIIKDAEHKMAVAVDHAREEFAAIRTGRAHPAMFNKLMVDYYGAGVDALVMAVKL